ncbi:MAG: P-loop NTPase fold protein, partial [Pyrinomonadaceae bacterium]
MDPGDRLVLFAEVTEDAASLDEWNAAKETLFNRLPERMGLVLSGAPADFKLTGDDGTADPHFLDLSLPEVEDSAVTTRSVVKFSNASFHRDQPASKDELDVNDYANALARFILHKQTLPPLTVGIHGRWGKGKSSFMKMVDHALVKHADMNIQRPKIWRWQPRRAIPPELASNPLTRFIRRLEAVPTEEPAQTEKWNDVVVELIRTEPDVQKLLTAKEPAEPKAKAERQRKIDDFKDRQKRETRLWGTMLRKAQQNVVSVWFNAWQFEDAKQTWAGLASQISERMEAALPWHSRQWLKIRYSVKERKSELVLNVLIPLAVVLVVAGLVWFGPLDSFKPGNSDSDLARLLRLLLPSSGLLTIWFASTQFLKVTQPVSERVLTYVRLPNYREQMGFQHRVKDDLRFVYQFLCKRRKNCRLVIYIDDLDRCSEGKIMELLQAINLILASCEFFVFVGMDTEMIYRAIGSHYKENMPDRFAENYLRKIIQISFYLPESKP